MGDSTRYWPIRSHASSLVVVGRQQGIEQIILKTNVSRQTLMVFAQEKRVIQAVVSILPRTGNEQVVQVRYNASVLLYLI